MQSTIGSTVACLGLMGFITLSSFLDDSSTPDRPAPTMAAENGIIMIDLGEGETGKGFALLDTQSRVLSVYQVDSRSFEVSLKSARKVVWDLQLDEFNGVKPTPAEIRSLVTPR